MHIALIHNAVLPVRGYGGTERLVSWLAKGLHARGVKLTLVLAVGSASELGSVLPFSEGPPLERALPDVDVFHYFNTPPIPPERPYIVTIGGNGKIGEMYLPNTVFVSRNHAERHGSHRFVYNGVDPDEYLFSAEKKGYLLFLAKAAWRVKNVEGAIRFARKTGKPLHILGGQRWLLNHWRGIHWEGKIGGVRKAEFVAGASALLWPIIWNEPFGIAVAEALVSGTPVIASRRGSSPELVDESVGFLCDSEDDFVRAIGEVPRISSHRCREWAVQHFHFLKMTDAYIKIYEEVLSGKTLNAKPPRASGPPEELLPLA